MWASGQGPFILEFQTLTPQKSFRVPSYLEPLLDRYNINVRIPLICTEYYSFQRIFTSVILSDPHKNFWVTQAGIPKEKL